MESTAENDSGKPVLILGNSTGLKSIVHYKAESLSSNWKKW